MSTAATPSPSLDNTTAALRRAWHCVAHSTELGAEPLAVKLLGEPWVIARLGDDGALAAFPDRCPHRLAPLSAGCVTDGELQCAYHGWRFRADGSCAAIPALGEGATLPPRAQLSGAYSVVESDGLVWLAPEEPMGPLPRLGADGPGFVTGFATTMRTAVGAAQLIDNFMDAAHFAFVHIETFGVQDATIARDDGIERDGAEVKARFATPYREGGEVVEHVVEKVGHAGFTAEVTLRFPASGGEFRILYACQAETPTSTRVFKAMARNDLPGTTLEEIAAAFQKLVDEEDAILLEDLAILGNYRDITLHLDPTVEVHTRADRLSLAWRRLMADAFFSAA